MSKKREGAVGGWIKRLPAPVKAAFVCCFICGFIAHIFAFTNIIPNSDGISRVADPQQMTVSGRWFLHYATAWNGFVQMPAVIGFFSVLFMSLSAALVCSVFKVRSAVLGGICGALMIVFPSVAYTYLYMFTASAYFFGVLLAVFAVFLSTRYKFGFLFAAVPLAFAIGTYQAYLAVAASLALIYVILYALEGGRSFKDVLIAALKQIAFLALGVALYYVILRVFLAVKGVELLSYKGIAAFGESFTLRGLISLVAGAYKTFVGYFFIPGKVATYTTVFGAVVNALFALGGIYAFVRLAVKKQVHRKIGALILTLALCLLLPLALNLSAVMGEAMPIMRYALVFTYLFALLLIDRLPDEGEPKGEKKQGISKIRAASAVLSAVACVTFFQIDNLAYTVSAQAHRSTESFAARLVERVESADGYKNGMQVVIIGPFPSDRYYNDIEPFKLVEDYSNLSTSVMPLNKHVYYYLNDWLNVPWEEPDEETMISTAESAEFKSMPLYPDDGSVRVADGKMIVKLAETYTPKKDYEIAYENRK